MVFDNKEYHSFVVSVGLDDRALKYIKSFKGLKGIPEEFCKSVIKNALKTEQARFSLDHEILVEFKISVEDVTYPEPY